MNYKWMLLLFFWNASVQAGSIDGVYLGECFSLKGGYTQAYSGREFLILTREPGFIHVGELRFAAMNCSGEPIYTTAPSQYTDLGMRITHVDTWDCRAKEEAWSHTKMKGCTSLTIEAENLNTGGDPLTAEYSFKIRNWNGKTDYEFVRNGHTVRYEGKLHSGPPDARKWTYVEKKPLAWLTGFTIK